MARQYGRALRFLLGKTKMKRFVTSGDLQRMFFAEDHKTIIRRQNCRKFCLDNDIYIDKWRIKMGNLNLSDGNKCPICGSTHLLHKEITIN